jgi:fatty acid desaturase
MGLEYSSDDQKKVDAKIETGVSASTKEASAILREIHETAWNLNEPDWRRSARIMAMFATLTVSLGIKADRVQKSMVILTVAIGIMTLVLLALTALMTYKMFFP